MLSNATTALKKQRARVDLFTWFAPSLADIIFVSILVVFLVHGTTILSADGDAARHLGVGTYILDHRSVPSVEMFSHTKGGQDFVPYEWLSEVAFTVAYRLLGLAGLLLVAGAAVALTFSLLFRFMLERGANSVVALLLTGMATIAASVHWLARPHVFTLLLATVWFVSLDRYHRGEKAGLYRLPLLMAVWANLHGGFLVGFVLLGVYGAAELVTWRLDSRRRESGQAKQRLLALAGVGVASSAATMLNPSSYRLIPHVLGWFGQSYTVDHTIEYLSPNFHETRFLPYMLLLLGMIVLFGMSRFKVGLLPLVLVAVFTYFSLYSVRNVPLFAIVVTPTMALAATRLWEGWTSAGTRSRLLDRALRRLRRSADNVLAIEREAQGHVAPVLAVAVFGLALLPSSRAGISWLNPSFSAKEFPVEAAQFLEENQIPGKMFNEFVWGGYLIYRLYPQYKVFIDGQTDSYGDGLVRDYSKVVEVTPDWQGVLDAHDVGWVLVPSTSALATLLLEADRWGLIYSDGTAAIFVRRSLVYQELLDRHPNVVPVREKRK